jgi:subtilisin-like proprotein convertase family protein
MGESRRLGQWIAILAGLALALGGQPPARPATAARPAPAGPPRLPAGEIPYVPAPPGCLATTQLFQHVGSELINDESTITSTLTVGGVWPYTWDVTAYTAISHTFSSDLRVFLIGPNEFGTRNTLTTRNGQGNDNVFAGTTWSDLAPLGVTEASSVNNVTAPYLIPEGAMGKHFGHNPNGIWKLVVEDVAEADIGQLNSWAVNVTTLPFAPIGASQFPSKVVNQAITNTDTITSSIVVTGAGTLLDNVTVNLVVPHTDSGELTITLMAPTGLTTTLTSGNGFTLTNLYKGVTFTDDPVGAFMGPVTDAAYVDGVNLGQVQPEGAMRHFAGIYPNGAWQLIISDSGGTGTGSLQSWQLGIYTSHCEAVYLPVISR